QQQASAVPMQDSKEWAKVRDNLAKQYVDMFKKPPPVGPDGLPDMDAMGKELSTAPTEPPDPYSVEKGRRITSSVEELEKMVGPSTVGFAVLANKVPTTDARDFAARLATLKGQIAFNELQEMRAASKTGGALGAVSERE